jgi:hypothetical protein
MANSKPRNVSSDADQLSDDAATKTSRPANETLAGRSDAQAAAEAVRMGLEDRSQEAGASVGTNPNSMASGQPTVANDPDAMQYQAKVVGEEAIGGTTPTPDQSDVDAVAAAAGVKTRPEHPVKVVEEMRKRDEHRHELDPESKGPAASA